MDTDSKTQTVKEKTEKKEKGKKGKKKPTLPKQLEQLAQSSREGGSWGNFTSILITILVLTMLYSFVSNGGKEVEQVSLSALVSDIRASEVTNIVIAGDKLTITYKDETEKEGKKEYNTALSETLVNYGLTAEELATVAIEVKNETGFRYWFFALAPIAVPLLLILVFVWYLSRQVRGAGMQAFTFGQSKARLTDPKDKNSRITFSDVAGAKEAKEELTEIVDFLKNPKKFLDIGARIPKGVLLMGAPGTGKTLLGRAVAGEAGVPFFSISGSEFVEMFVGVGASRVRDLFQMAKRAAPAIIFVDEIDAVGRVRGTGVGGGNDEREQTLNQILVEMDGFEPSEKVIVMAATNRPDVLDPALLRPGRFDRRVTIDLPDREGREEILKIHARKKPLAEDVNLKIVAERTPGFSGADLQSLMNEGAILAAREDRKKVAQFDLVRSIEKVMLGPERKTHILSRKEKEITAYHEAGHALVASVLPYADPVHKISIISRGRAAGYTLKLPLDDKKMQSRNEFLDDIAVSLGGYIAEEMVFGDLTTGPSNDLQVLTALARDMVTKYGMSSVMGPVALEGEGGRAMFWRGMNEKEYSPEVSAKIDAEVKKIIDDAYRKATDLIVKHRPVLDAIAKKLVVEENIERDEFEKLLILHGIEPKKKQDIEHQP